MLDPLLILLIGVVTVVGLIIVLRVNAFIALVAAAMLVSLLSPGDWALKISRVAAEFGKAAGNIGIVIALAAVIGKCLMDSGAADKIVRSFLRVLGEKRASTALVGSGFVLAVPVFFDTVFYLLIPLARSLYRRTHKNYVLYVTAIGAGAAITHTLVPPTPGPLFIASELRIDLGMMILMGTAIALPTAVVGLISCHVINRLADIPMRSYSGEVEPEPLADEQLPGLFVSILPVVLPVILISANTFAKALGATRTAQVTSVLGDPNLALFISAVIAMLVLVQNRGLSLKELGKATETALMSGGVIILITAGGGAFGAMLREAGVQGSIESMVDLEGQSIGIVILCLAFFVSSVLKIAQGSSTVAMITTSSMLAAMGVTSTMLGCHMVYLATAIGCGSLVGSWMNDSGFWIFSKMGALTEIETLKVWSVLLVVLGAAGFAFTLLFAWLLPLG